MSLDEVPSIKRKKIEKHFTVNGTIPPTNQDCYLIDPVSDDWFKNILAPGRYTLFFGARGSGKTTKILRLLKHVEERYFCIYVSMQRGISVQDPKDFWPTLCSAMRAGHSSIPLFDTGATFANLFNLDANTFNGKRVVLAIDELDLLYEAQDDKVKTEFLNVLRSLCQGAREEKSTLLAFIGIGPFSILQLSGETTSPFNVTDAVPNPPFARDEVVGLFKEYAEDRGYGSWDNAIAEDIHMRTGGHAGLICFCGKQIDERMLRGKASFPTFNEWLKFAGEHLVSHLWNSWATAARMVERLSSPTPKTKPAIELLVTTFLPSNDSVTIEDVEHIKYAKFLTAEGILTQGESEHSFCLSSPLVRNLALRAAHTSGLNYPAPELLRLPLNVPQVIKQLLPCFDRPFMTRATFLAWKQNRSPGFSRRKVPSEACYHFQLFRLLAGWMKHMCLVFCEGNARTDTATADMFADIVITEGGDYEDYTARYVLELVASQNDASVTKHIEHVAAYSTALKATETWVINFTLSFDQPQTCFALPDGVSLLHVVHDLDWQKATLCGPNRSQEVVSLVD